MNVSMRMESIRPRCSQNGTKFIRTLTVTTLLLPLLLLLLPLIIITTVPVITITITNNIRIRILTAGRKRDQDQDQDPEMNPESDPAAKLIVGMGIKVGRTKESHCKRGHHRHLFPRLCRQIIPGITGLTSVLQRWPPAWLTVGMVVESILVVENLIDFIIRFWTKLL